jgi:hypothetical protein
MCACVRAHVCCLCAYACVRACVRVCVYTHTHTGCKSASAQWLEGKRTSSDTSESEFVGGTRDVGVDVGGGSGGHDGGAGGGSLAGDAGDEWERGEGGGEREREGPRLTTKASGDAMEGMANRGTEGGGGGVGGGGGQEAMAKLQKKMDEDWEELLQVRNVFSPLYGLSFVSHM